MTGRVLVWFRRDLRVLDNQALAAAMSEADEVVPVFIFDRPLLDAKVFGSACVAFMLECLQDLATSLAARGLRFHWRHGDPREEIPRLAKDLRVDALYWNRDFEPAAVQRDQTVAKTLAQLGVVLKTFKDHLVFEPDELRNLSGRPFQRYSAFRTAWWKKWLANPLMSSSAGFRPVEPGFRSRSRPAPESDFLPSIMTLGHEPTDLVIRGGERMARSRLRDFVAGGLHTYGVGRNRPAEDATSVLSPHFRFGTLSPRTAIQAALQSLTSRGGVSRSDVYTWIDELVWREFFHHVLAGYPHVAGQPFRASASVAPARSDGTEAEHLYRAWCEGRTGYPLVDAGMRQLNQTGWMHNRVRMVVASFLVKDLRLDWRWGERYFMSRLLDADLAVNNGNWQWCASTGTDSMPGYRIFNPTTQGTKFDPRGDYVRRYVPELAAVPAKFIHAPAQMSIHLQDQSRCRMGVDYPMPIIEHDRARREYLALAGARMSAFKGE